MSWGTELWDQFENIALHTQKGLDFCEKYGHFLKERAAIERDYAAKLKKLVKSYQPRKKEEEEQQFSTYKGFQAMIQEINDIAGQHETISENLNSIVSNDLASMLSELKNDRKKHLQEGADQMKMLQNQLNSLERSKKSYEKASRESDRAQEAYKKADADINLSRADVEKSKNTSITKQQICEECKNEYASELQKTNDAQHNHYQQLMPRIFQQLQDLDEKRTCRLQEFIRQCAETERNVMPIIHSCIDGMVKGSEKVDSAKDSKIVIDRYKSGLQPPGDIPFEDLSCTSPPENHIQSNTPRGSLRTETLKGTVSGGKLKKRTGLFGIFSHSKKDSSWLGQMIPRDRSLRGSINGLFRTDDSKEDYSHLPPNQQKRKLQQKIDIILSAVAKETAERDGMLKMRDVYVQNPALGDASSLDKQVDENAQKLDKLRQELQKFEGYMAEAVGRLSAQKQGLSQSDDSISRSASEISVTSSDPSTPQQIHQPIPVAKDSPDSGVDNTNRISLGDQDQDQDSFDDGLEEFPVVGSCVALYTFEATNEGSIAMTEGEDFHVLEMDQGDGWTRVRRTNGEEGFVPSSYIEMTVYEQ